MFRLENRDLVLMFQLTWKIQIIVNHFHERIFCANFHQHSLKVVD